jgi:molybdenum cofactor cytidylyltransferase
VIAGILLAAGSGTRFGSHKLLHPLPDGMPLVIASLRALREGVDEVIAVVRPGDAALSKLLEKEQARVIVCEHAAQGMGASLACGVRATANAQGWLIALGDMPSIPSPIVARLAARLRAGCAVVAPVCRGRRGHPVGFGREFFPALSELNGDAGARAILGAHAARLELLHTDHPGVLRDVDTPYDLPGIARL